MEENMRRVAGKEEEERGAASALLGPARRSLHRWARPAPYTPSSRRFVSNLLSKPSSSIRSLRDTSRFSLPRLPDIANDSTLERGQTSGTSKHELLQENEQVAVHDRELAEIEQCLKKRIFTRDEVDHLIEVIRSRTPALNKVAPLPITAPQYPVRAESKQAGLLGHRTMAWKPGDSVYSKVNAGCTPIEMAKAYMRELSSSGADSCTKSRICWPGAILPDNNSVCVTPQSSKGNTVLGATPSCSDSHFSRSTFKVKSDRDSYDLFSTGRKRRLTPIDGAENKKTRLQETTLEVADPETNGENTMATFTQKGAYPINKPQHTSQSSLGKGEDEVAVSGASSLRVHRRKSTETAQKILSHLERAIPSPSDKRPLQKQITREIPSDSLLFKNKRQESFRGSGTSNQKMPDVNMDNGALKSDAMTTKQNSEMGGLSFTFPLPSVNIASSEPPPTPTMPSPRAVPVTVNVPAVPTFNFGSSSSSSRLVFSFGSSVNDSTILDEAPPIFKFGSEEKRLSFSFAEKDGVCY